MAITETPIQPYLYDQYRYASGAANMFAVHRAALNARWAELRDRYVNLPDYTSETITGTLLSWVCESIYGVPRPTLQYSITKYDVSTYDSALYDLASDAIPAPDDVLRKIVEWNCKRDMMGPFSIPVLKHKCAAFLGVPVESIYVSQSGRVFTVSVPTNYYSPSLQACFELSVVNLPCEYQMVLEVDAIR